MKNVKKDIENSDWVGIVDQTPGGEPGLVLKVEASPFSWDIFTLQPGKMQSIDWRLVVEKRVAVKGTLKRPPHPECYPILSVDYITPLSKNPYQ